MITDIRGKFITAMTCFLVVIAVSFGGSCFAFSDADFDKAVRSTMSESNLVGVSVAVFHDDQLVFSKGYGYANVKKFVPMSSDSIFRVAGLSRMITAAAIMKLHDQRRINLDDDISNYFGFKIRNPMYPQEPITIRQLLLQTSSFKDSGCYNNLMNGNSRIFRSIGLDELLMPQGKYYDKSLFSQAAPGETFSYCNLNFGVLGGIVELASGKRFDDYCRKEILLPLGMDAGFDPADIVNWRNFGAIYRYRSGSRYEVLDDLSGGKPKPLKITAPLGNPIGWSPTGGLRVSANDMSKFLMMLANGGAYGDKRVLTSVSAYMMQQVFWMGLSFDGLDEQVGLFRQEGLGVNITDQLCDGWRLTGYSGDAYGLISGAYFDTLSKLGFVYIINGGNYRTALPQSPAYVSEREIATAINSRYEELVQDKRLNIAIASGGGRIAVNGRIIWLPAGTSVDKDFYLPLITINDVLGLAVDEGESGAYYFTRKDKNLKIVLKDATMTVSGYINTYLPKPPYSKNGVIYVPLKQIADALEIKVVYSNLGG